MGDRMRFVRSLDVHAEITADPNDDLIPIGDSTMDRPNHIEPIEPTYRRANITRDPANPNNWKYIFHPGEVYSDTNWLNQHEVRYATFLRMGVVDFARSVAGGTNRKLIDMLDTGFDDINSIMRDSAHRGDLVMKGRFSEAPLPPAELSEVTRKELADLTAFIRNEDEKVVAGDVLRLLSMIQQRNQEHAKEIVRWSTLPYNLQKFYYKENLKTAVEYSLDNICDIARRRIPFGELFSDLIAGPKRTDFVRLVAAQLKLIFHGGIGGYNKTAKESDDLKLDIQNCLMDFRRYYPGVRPELDETIESPSSESRSINSKLRNPI